MGVNQKWSKISLGVMWVVLVSTKMAWDQSGNSMGWKWSANQNGHVGQNGLVQSKWPPPIKMATNQNGLPIKMAANQNGRQSKWPAIQNGGQSKWPPIKMAANQNGRHVGANVATNQKWSLKWPPCQNGHQSKVVCNPH